MAGIGATAIGASLMAASTTSLVTASATTHWYPSTISVTPSSGGQVGTILSAVAHVAGHNPTGTVRFLLFPPSDQTCSGGAVFASGPRALEHRMATSGPGYKSTGAGTYNWKAIYSGDSDNFSKSSGCIGATTITGSGVQGNNDGGGGSGVLGAAVTPSVPETGAAIPGAFGGALLLVIGPGLVILARRPERHLTSD